MLRERTDLWGGMARYRGDRGEIEGRSRGDRGEIWCSERAPICGHAGLQPGHRQVRLPPRVAGGTPMHPGCSVHGSQGTPLCGSRPPRRAAAVHDGSHPQPLPTGAYTVSDIHAHVHVHAHTACACASSWRGLTRGGGPHCRSASRLALPRRATGARHAPAGLDRAPLRGRRASARAREALLVLLGSAHERGRAARVGRAARARQRRRRRRPRGLIDFDADGDAHPTAPRRTGPLELGGAFGRGGGGGGLLGGGPQEVGPGTHRLAAWGRVRADAAHGWAGLQG